MLELARGWWQLSRSNELKDRGSSNPLGRPGTMRHAAERRMMCRVDRLCIAESGSQLALCFIPCIWHEPEVAECPLLRRCRTNNPAFAVVTRNTGLNDWPRSLSLYGSAENAVALMQMGTDNGDPRCPPLCVYSAPAALGFRRMRNAQQPAAPRGLITISRINKTLQSERQ